MLKSAVKLIGFVFKNTIKGVKGEAEVKQAQEKTKQIQEEHREVRDNFSYKNFAEYSKNIIFKTAIAISGSLVVLPIFTFFILMYVQAFKTGNWEHIFNFGQARFLELWQILIPTFLGSGAIGYGAYKTVAKSTEHKRIEARYKLDKTKNTIQQLVIHCTDTPDGRKVTPRDIRKWHTSPKPKGRGWKQVGYHVLIGVDGRIYNMVYIDDDEYISGKEVANGVWGENQQSIHVCYAGGKLDRDDDYQDWRSHVNLKQKESLIKVINMAVGKYGSTLKHIVGHRDRDDKKTCPNFSVYSFLRDNLGGDFADKYGVL